MPTTQASPAVGDFTPNAVFQEGKGKTDALTLLSQAYFLSAVKVKRDLDRDRILFSKAGYAQARPDRDRIPAFSKAGIPLPSSKLATAATL